MRTIFLTMRDRNVLEELGHRLYRAREARGLTMSEVAERSGLSRRYLSEAEAGRANLSVLKLARLALALKISLPELCDLPLEAAGVQRVALVGLRGAGKSTLGRKLALSLEVPFIELDLLVEERGGLPLETLFSIHGEALYRRLEREALENTLERSGACVLAAGGSIVQEKETWARLRETCFVVWLKATPDDHWRRVIDQGDLRPMAAHPRAMDELREMLKRRAPLYSEAHGVIETSGKTIEEVHRELLSLTSERHGDDI